MMGTRKLVVGPYILTTRQRKGFVEVVAIRDGRQGDSLVPKEAEETGTSQSGSPRGRTS